ncbi:trans-1,2-dihydrobenzene-1,2-diol dehydrogenase [Anabrus simplex]|uniref:trans-1,2-dihydrobenzene-1,2-diol dehydrogenase n=1 Tax=Anabrus simplex TaxID=316456 RepID=UPI0034DD7D51
MATRWGIASAGKISHDFVTALSTLPSEEHVVVAVAARQLERAQEFAKLHKISKAYGSYEELAKDNNIDVVYIGSINPHHLSIGKLMLNSGKPILCEKPLTMNLKQTQELISLAREKKLFLMEAVWSRCFPVYEALKKEINAGALGEVVQVNATFGIPVEDVDRVMKKALGGSTILDLGVYCLQFALFIYGPVRPKNVVALGHLNDEGVDVSMSCIFTYENGKTAVLSTHARAQFPNEALVIGTKGTARVPNPFWCPTQVSLPDKTSEFILPTAALPFNFTNSAGLRYEAMEVRRCLKEGLLESPKITHQESLLLAELEDTLRKQLGVEYPEDN